MLGELAAAVRRTAARIRRASSCRPRWRAIERLNPALNAVTRPCRSRRSRTLERWTRSVLDSDALARGPAAPRQGQHRRRRARHELRLATMVDRPPPSAASITVERLDRAGAVVIVGRTNIPEFAFQGWTANDVFGVDAQPVGDRVVARRLERRLRLRRSRPALAPLATATDGGGSTRTPAAVLRARRAEADGRHDRTSPDPVVDGGLDAGPLAPRSPTRGSCSRSCAGPPTATRRAGAPLGRTATRCRARASPPTGRGTSVRCPRRWRSGSGRRSTRSSATSASPSRRSLPPTCSPASWPRAVTAGWIGTSPSRSRSSSGSAAGGCESGPGRVQRGVPRRDGEGARRRDLETTSR